MCACIVQVHTYQTMIHVFIFAHFIEMIDEILSTVDDTTFGESIATYFHSEKLKFYVMYFFRRGELE